MSRKSLAFVLSVLLIATCLHTNALADWPNGQPTKYFQLPDKTPLGMDVYNSVIPGIVPPVGVGKYLADDFPCTTPGPITDIHIWGSWLHDVLPVNAAGAPDPSAVAFKLSIHEDIPATPDSPSRPGATLWERIVPPGSFKVVPAVQVPDGEGFYNPNTGEFVRAADKVIWQYNFTIPTTDQPFFQKGTAANPVIYWLDVLAAPQDPNAIFGWKTRDPNPQNPGGGHFLDDAVWGDGFFGIGGSPTGWQDLRYPSGHPYAGQSIDLSFALTTIPEPASFSLVGIGSLLLLKRRK